MCMANAVQQILTDVPDYVERCHYLESLKNRLEALLSPHVVAAFSAQSLGMSATFAEAKTEVLSTRPRHYKARPT